MKVEPPVVAAFRWSTLMMGAATVLGGTGAAAMRGNMEVMPAIICLLFAMSAQMASNMTYSHTLLSDRVSHARKESAGGFPVPTELVERCAAARIGMNASILLTVMIGLALIAIGGVWTLIPGALIAILAWLLYARPFMLIESQWAPLICFLIFGPIGVFSTMMVQGVWSPGNPWTWYDCQLGIYLGLSFGFYAAACQLLFHLSAFEKGTGTHRLILPARMGVPFTAGAIQACAVIGAAIIIVCCLTLQIWEPWVSMIPPAAAMIATFVLVYCGVLSHRMPMARVPLTGMAIFFCYGLLMLIAGIITGDPDRGGYLM